MFKNAILLFIFALSILVIFLPSYQKMQELKNRNLQYQGQIEDLEEKKARLTEELRRLNDDPEYLEKVGREEMGLIRKGETVYRVVPE
ncbi:MAG: septum formation initiator family protein [Candidatus Omnitrophica bacterium]|nr:septum formation initiator family protein [Candidatus Omnitrophota bacterium]